MFGLFCLLFYLLFIWRWLDATLDLTFGLTQNTRHVAGIPRMYLSDTCAVACDAFDSYLVYLYLNMCLIAIYLPVASCHTFSLTLSLFPLCLCLPLSNAQVWRTFLKFPRTFLRTFFTVEKCKRQCRNSRQYDWNETCGPEIVQLKYLRVLCATSVRGCGEGGVRGMQHKVIESWN